MRTEIGELIQLGQLPAEGKATVDHLRAVEFLLSSITKPVSNEEACALAGLFGTDSCFGLAWTILHLIESAPNWPIAECFSKTDNEWISELKERAVRGGLI